MQRANDQLLVDRQVPLGRGAVHVRISLEASEAEQEAWVRLSIEDDEGDTAEAAVVFWSFTGERGHRGPAFTTTMSCPGAREPGVGPSLTDRLVLGLSALLGQLLGCWHEQPPRGPSELLANIQHRASRFEAVTAAIVAV